MLAVLTGIVRVVRGCCRCCYTCCRRLKSSSVVNCCPCGSVFVNFPLIRECLSSRWWCGKLRMDVIDWTKNKELTPQL